MAVSEKYQVLPFGVGYQVIIYQYYGWGCIGSAIILKAWRYFLTKFKHAEKKLIVFDGIIMLITVYLIAVNQQNTRWTIKEMELKEASVSAQYNQIWPAIAEEVGLSHSVIAPTNTQPLPPPLPVPRADGGRQTRQKLLSSATLLYFRP